MNPEKQMTSASGRLLHSGQLQCYIISFLVSFSPHLSSGAAGSNTGRRAEQWGKGEETGHTHSAPQTPARLGHTGTKREAPIDKRLEFSYETGLHFLIFFCFLLLFY